MLFLVLVQRVVPFLVSLLGDKYPLVRAHALCGLTHILAAVREFPAGDALLFPTYILPALSKLQFDPEMVVQLAFAEALPMVRLICVRLYSTYSQFIASLLCRVPSPG